MKDRDRQYIAFVAAYALVLPLAMIAGSRVGEMKNTFWASTEGHIVLGAVIGIFLQYTLGDLLDLLFSAVLSLFRLWRVKRVES